MCIQRSFAVMISLALAVLHQNKSLLDIAVSQLYASQTCRDYGIEHVFFLADFIGTMFNDPSHFITRNQNDQEKNTSNNCVVHELALLSLGSSVMCLLAVGCC